MCGIGIDCVAVDRGVEETLRVGGIRYVCANKQVPTHVRGEGRE